MKRLAQCGPFLFMLHCSRIIFGAPTFRENRGQGRFTKNVSTLHLPQWLLPHLLGFEAARTCMKLMDERTHAVMSGTKTPSPPLEEEDAA